MPQIPYTSAKIFCMAIWLFQATAANAEIHGTLTGTTNYVYKMYSKSNNGPAIQANLDYQHSSGFYAGTSVSSFNIGGSEINEGFHFPDQARAEISPYLGWSFKLADNWRFDAQYTRNFYDNKVYEFSGDFNEFYLFLHYKDILSANISFTDDFYGIGNIALFYEFTGCYPITDFLEFSSTFGYGQTKFVLFDDYPYWNAGLTGRYKFIALDLRYYDAKEIHFPHPFGQPNHPDKLTATVVFTISVGF